jgi:hypothetical protein
MLDSRKCVEQIERKVRLILKISHNFPECPVSVTLSSAFSSLPLCKNARSPREHLRKETGSEKDSNDREFSLHFLT